MPSSYYTANLSHTTGPSGFCLMKNGINSTDKSASEYTSQRYGPGTKALYGRKFRMTMRELEMKVERPILNILKTRGDICEIVCGKKEHFWVKDTDVPKFVKLVKHLVATHANG
jgi:hypothetical protein